MVQILGVFRPPQPQISKFMNETPKRHLLSSKHAFWCIGRQHTSIGVTCGRVDETKKWKVFGRQCHPFRGVPYPYRKFTIFGTCCHPHDVIICAVFHVNPFTRFGLARGRIFHFPLWKHCRLYNSLALPGRLWYSLQFSPQFTSLSSSTSSNFPTHSFSFPISCLFNSPSLIPESYPVWIP